MSKPKEYPLGALQGEELKLVRPEHTKFYFVDSVGEIPDKDITVMRHGDHILYRMLVKQLHGNPFTKWPGIFFFLNQWHAYAYFLKVTQEPPNE